MYICGIVCEYNPFHLGHRYQIDRIRELLGEDTAIVCVMSGDFVQRGEAAAFSKYDRARAAAAGGADLVIELPLPWSISSAEGFARGGIGALGALGMVTHVAFGSECGELSALEHTTGILLSSGFDEKLREELGRGVSYAAARQAALTRLAGEAAAKPLSSPNDILAVEYLKALRMQKLSMKAIAIRRSGAAHDSSEDDAMPSASFLRGKLAAGEDVSRYLPASTARLLAEGEGYADRIRLETALLSRLRFLREADFAAVPDAAEGLHNRLYRAAHTEPALQDVISAAATKRYPEARIRRMLLCAALGVRAGDPAGTPPYLRVLAANSVGLSVLRGAEKAASVPLISKPSKLRELGGEAEHIFELGAAASDLFGLCLTDADAARGDRDWRRGPAILP